MNFRVKEMFYTLQGEGAQAGRPAVFLRFAGCNLWSGRSEDRPQAACPFCDTDFVGTDGPGGGVYPDAAALTAAVRALWPAFSRTMATDSVENSAASESPAIGAEGDWSGGGSAASRAGRPYVVCTGGEPTLQLTAALVAALHQAGFEVAIETNGTRAVPEGVDWICVSPKAGTTLVQRSGSELKLVHPQGALDPAEFLSLDFVHFVLQPKDGPERAANTRAALRYCLDHPEWRLGLQTHKLLGIA